MSHTMPPRELPLLFAHTTAVLFLLTVGYYLLPLRSPTQPESVARLTVSVLALITVLFLLRSQASRSRHSLSSAMHRIQWLLTALYVLVLSFALVYATVAELAVGQFFGIENRTDALYFSVTLVSTVGFGDVHAVGTLARLLVTVHMLFNLIYLGTALRLLGSTPPAGKGQG
ncbi:MULTISPECIES: potassium channel family protein [unclassified Ornithinimicrobium]|uniref:potassium channel family protein n=1 Tax=unclassified Ornithinimicrobium TaxID=2615080 RepID=UPI0038554AC0